MVELDELGPGLRLGGAVGGLQFGEVAFGSLADARQVAEDLLSNGVIEDVVAVREADA